MGKISKKEKRDCQNPEKIKKKYKFKNLFQKTNVQFQFFLDFRRYLFFFFEVSVKIPKYEDYFLKNN